MFDLVNPTSVSRLVALLACIYAIGCGYFSGYPKAGSHDIRFSEVRYTMGTLLDLTLYASSEEEGRQLLDGAFAIVEELNQELSTWIADSPISVLNHQPVTTPLMVSESLYSSSQRRSGYRRKQMVRSPSRCVHWLICGKRPRAGIHYRQRKRSRKCKSLSLPRPLRLSRHIVYGSAFRGS